jgi:hypothetical protein
MNNMEEKFYSSIPESQVIHQLRTIKMSNAGNFRIDGTRYNVVRIPDYPNFKLEWNDTIKSMDIWCWPINEIPTHKNLKPVILRLDMNHIVENVNGEAYVSIKYQNVWNLFRYWTGLKDEFYTRSVYCVIEDVIGTRSSYSKHVTKNGGEYDVYGN